MFVRSLWKLEIHGCLYTFPMCILLCASRWALVHICEDREQLGLTSCLFQSSGPVLHQGRCMLLWRKLWGFFYPGQLVSQIHNHANTVMNNTSRAEHVFILFKREGCKGTWCTTPMTIGLLFHLFDRVCLCLLQRSYFRSKRGERISKQSKLSSAMLCGHNHQSPSTFPIHSPCV